MISAICSCAMQCYAAKLQRIRALAEYKTRRVETKNPVYSYSLRTWQLVLSSCEKKPPTTWSGVLRKLGYETDCRFTISCFGSHVIDPPATISLSVETPQKGEKLSTRRYCSSRGRDGVSKLSVTFPPRVQDVPRGPSVSSTTGGGTIPRICGLVLVLTPR